MNAPPCESTNCAGMAYLTGRGSSVCTQSPLPVRYTLCGHGVPHREGVLCVHTITLPRKIHTVRVCVPHKEGVLCVRMCTCSCPNPSTVLGEQLASQYRHYTKDWREEAEFKILVKHTLYIIYTMQCSDCVSYRVVALTTYLTRRGACAIGNACVRPAANVVHDKISPWDTL
jgi:hypothetical protein